MAVAAVGVVAEEDVHLLLVEDREARLGSLVRVGPDEAGAPPRVREQLGAEAAVRAEMLDAGDSQCPGARLQLPTSPRGEAARDVGLRCQPKLAVRRDDEDDAMSLRAARAIVPDVSKASSSGCAWNASRV